MLRARARLRPIPRDARGLILVPSRRRDDPVVLGNQLARLVRVRLGAALLLPTGCLMFLASTVRSRSRTTTSGSSWSRWRSAESAAGSPSRRWRC